MGIAHSAARDRRRGCGLLLRGLLAFVAAGGAARGDPGAPPVTLADLALADQHGVVRPVPPETRVVLFARDMDAGAIVTGLLEERPAGWLERHRAVYIADIHRMPALVSRFVALPRMRRWPWRVLLVTDAQTGRRFPAEAGAVTVLPVDGVRPTGPPRFARTVAELEAAVRGLAGAAAGPAGP